MNIRHLALLGALSLAAPAAAQGRGATVGP